ncbi:MAG: hypothetical protein KIT14_17585 [bacterium]|nr:hypothetical protein [bacterium]
MTLPRLLFAACGLVLSLVVAELAARIHGDRVCTAAPGLFYTDDASLGWRHLPDLTGWARVCEIAAMRAAPVAVTADGGLDPARPRAKPPGVARVLLLGGNGPEGVGVPPELRMARVMEEMADANRGDRVEVLSFATGGYALDNQLALLRGGALEYQPDAVVVVVTPNFETAALSPTLLAAHNPRVNRKPFLQVLQGRLMPYPLPAASRDPAPAPPQGLAAVSQLWRLVTGTPTRVGSPIPYVNLPLPSQVDLDLESQRVHDLVPALLEAMRDEVAAAGGRLVLAIGPVPPASRPLDDVERRHFVEVGERLGIPLVHLGTAFNVSRTKGYVPGSARWSAFGHFIAGSTVWTQLMVQGLLPPTVVTARVFGTGQRAPDLAEVPGALLARLWEMRQGPVARFITFALLAAFVCWIAALLPPGGRDGVLLVVSLAVVVGMVGPALAGGALAFAVVFHLVVDALPRRPALLAAVVLCLIVVAAPLALPFEGVFGEAFDQRLFLALATQVVLLRLWAYAVEVPPAGRALREYLLALFAFPTVQAGPVETPASFAARHTPGGHVPTTWAGLGQRLGAGAAGLGLVALGAAEMVAGPLLFGTRTGDVFATRGADVSRPMLWLWALGLVANVGLMAAGVGHVARGLGLLADTPVPAMFRRPWQLAGPADFWRRWLAPFHDWVHRFVFVPLGGGVAAVLAVFLLSALWHAWLPMKVLGPALFAPPAAAGFVVWGLVGALLLLVTRAAAPRLAGFAGGPVARVGGALLALAMAAVLWVAWSLPGYRSVGDLVAVWARMFGG